MTGCVQVRAFRHRNSTGDWLSRLLNEYRQIVPLVQNTRDSDPLAEVLTRPVLQLIDPYIEVVAPECCAKLAGFRGAFQRDLLTELSVHFRMASASAE